MVINSAVIEVEKNNIPDDGLLALEQAGHEVAVCKVGQSYFAFHDNCTHEDWKLSDGFMLDDHIVCSLHGAVFDPVTGVCKRAPASDPLRLYKVIEDGEKLLIQLENEK
jgi:nitrite reductase/ring-hydroxylating ferredoxin subunit